MSAAELKFHGSVRTRSEASPFLKHAGDAILVERGCPRLFVLLCPCGCGEALPINLDARAGPAWRLYKDNRSRISLFPSVWRESRCMSHFIIWRDQILLFGHNDQEFDSSSQRVDIADLTEAVMATLSTSKLVSFAELANDLDAVPWDVLTVCRALVRTGYAVEGEGKARGNFALRRQ